MGPGAAGGGYRRATGETLTGAKILGLHMTHTVGGLYPRQLLAVREYRRFAERHRWGWKWQTSLRLKASAKQKVVHGCVVRIHNNIVSKVEISNTRFSKYKIMGCSGRQKETPEHFSHGVLYSLLLIALLPSPGVVLFK